MLSSTRKFVSLREALKKQYLDGKKHWPSVLSLSDTKTRNLHPGRLSTASLFFNAKKRECECAHRSKNT